MHQKILLNSISIYIRIVINAIIALYSTRIVLATLGEIDYGLFVLIGGVIMLLSFLNGALLLSTQRFLSISMGKKDWEELRVVFNSSLSLHIIIAISVFLLFQIFQSLLIDDLLNIPVQKLATAHSVYSIVTITACITFITVPYNAIINAREDIWFISITDIMGALLRLGAALIIVLSTNQSSLLEKYAFMIMLSGIIVFIVQFIWTRRKYPETKLLKKYLFDKNQIKNQLGFTGWNTLVSFSMVCRNQGVAVVLNIFFGTVINSAYGIANQLNALLLTFSTAITNVFAPQIIKSKGAGNDERMLKLANTSTKISFYLASLIGIPLILECGFILSLWLKIVPTYSVEFCRILIAVFIIMQMYPGLVRCLYAHGKIKWYQITVSVLLILPLPIGYLIYNFFESPQIIIYLLFIAQFFTFISTIFFSKKYLNMTLRNSIINLLIKPILVFSLTFIIIRTFQGFLSEGIYRAIAVFITNFLITTLLTYILLVSGEEKNYLKGLIKGVLKKL